MCSTKLYYTFVQHLTLRDMITANYQIDQRITYNGLVHVITSIDHVRQMVELYNTYTGSFYDIKVSDL